MKNIYILAFVLVMTACSNNQPGQSSAVLLTDRIAADSIIKGLPLEQHQTTQSGNGRTKQLWKIAGAENSSFEIIGNIQSDADLVGWYCMEYNPDGSYASLVRDNSFCHKFFIQVLRNVLTKPEAVASDLLIKAKRLEPQTAVQEFGDLSVETDGGFYYLRRISRQ